MTDPKADALIRDWLESQGQARRCCYAELRSLEHAQMLWRETVTAVAEDKQPPVISYRGRYWWVTDLDVKGSGVVKVRLHEALEVVYVQGDGK